MKSPRHMVIPDPVRRRIYEIVCAVPKGRVSTYGDIALVAGGGINAWMVGQALNQIPKHDSHEIPWQRIVNAQGGISTSGLLQRKLLEDEGVVFDDEGKIDLRRFRWHGPPEAWAAEHGFQTLPSDEEPATEQLPLL